MNTPDPSTMKDRAFANLCDDLWDIASGKSRSFERVDALRHVRKHVGDCRSGTVAGREPSPSGLGPDGRPSTIARKMA